MLFFDSIRYEGFSLDTIRYDTIYSIAHPFVTMVVASIMCRDNENVTPSWRSGFTSAVDSSSGLVVRIPGSHPGGPGSIPGVGNPFWTPGIEYTFQNVKMVVFLLVGGGRK